MIKSLMNSQKDQFEYVIQGNFISGYSSFPWYKSRLVRWILYLSTSWIYYIVLWIAGVFAPKFVSRRYKVAVCAIFKNEGRFLKEWLDYHIVAGVDHFFMYNNNSEDNYNDVITPYIERGIVTLIDWPQNHAQMECYRHCYEEYKNICEWIGFIDLDEFVCPISRSSIGEWLDKFKKKPGVAIYWKQFGSNGILEHDFSKLVIEQYTQCWPKLSSYTKMFLNTRYNHLIGSQMHLFNSLIIGLPIPPINQFGKIIKYGLNIGNNNIDIQLNHYWGKSWDEFITKINRSAATKKTNEQLRRMRLERLFPHEKMCTVKDFTIQRFLLETKLAWDNKDQLIKEIKQD